VSRSWFDRALTAELSCGKRAAITFKDGKRIFFGGSPPVEGLDEEGRLCLWQGRGVPALSFYL